jgi:transposase
LRAIAAHIDFSFIRQEVADRYGHNGHVSIDPAILLKMMFLLFYDDLASERELMGVIAERLDYLWFLGYGLDDAIPHHNVLSKARQRWGRAAFEGFFVRTVWQCVQAGLVEGRKIHLDASLVDANAAMGSLVKAPAELIAALKQAYQAQENKLEQPGAVAGVVTCNDQMLSPTDPDAPLARKGPAPARPRYQHHRAVDDVHGVITAVATTPGTVAEDKKLLALVEQHQANTQRTVQTVVADTKYGTADNFIACQQQGWGTHLGDVLSRQKNDPKREGIFTESAFTYQPARNVYSVPGRAGVDAAPSAARPPELGVQNPSQHLCALCVARAMHPFGAGPVDPPPRAAGTSGPRPGASPQRGRAGRSSSPANAHGRQLCRRSQQPWIQTRPLAAAVAPTDSRLVDCRHPKHPPAVAASRPQARRCGGWRGCGPADSPDNALASAPARQSAPPLVEQVAART